MGSAYTTTHETKISFTRSTSDLPHWREVEGVKVTHYRKKLEELKTIRALGSEVRPEYECEGNHTLYKLMQAEVVEESGKRIKVVFSRCVYCNLGQYKSETRLQNANME